MREIYRSVNRPKIVVSSRLPTRDMVRTGKCVWLWVGCPVWCVLCCVKVCTSMSLRYLLLLCGVRTGLARNSCGSESGLTVLCMSFQVNKAHSAAQQASAQRKKE
jgi:hypothetical protein